MSDDHVNLFRIEERVGYCVLLINGKLYPNEYATREQAERAAEEIDGHWTEED